MKFHCAQCGEIHDELPDIGWDRPDQYWDVPEEFRERDIELTSNTCVILNQYYFIRGVLEIPIHGEAESLGLGVWVSQKREHFECYVNEPDSSEIGSFFGWFSTQIDFYEVETLNLKSLVHFRGNGLRPLIELEQSDYPLSRFYHHGISLQKALEFIHYYLTDVDPIYRYA